MAFPTVSWRHTELFRVIARKDGERVRLYSRPGNDLTKRFPLIVEAMAPAAHPARSMARRLRAMTAGSNHSTCFGTASETTKCFQAILQQRS